MKEIQWLKEAEDELAAIVDYVLQNQGQKVALEVYESIISQIDLLAEFSEIGTSETKYKFKGKPLRVLHSWHTRVFYIVQETRIDIVLLWSNRMDDRKIKKVLFERN